LRYVIIEGCEEEAGWVEESKTLKPWLPGDDIDNDVGILEVEITKMNGKHFPR